MTGARRERRSPAAPAPGPPPLPASSGGPAPPEAGPERLYILTGGSDSGRRAELDLVTLVVARSGPSPGATPEERALLRLCAGPLSVAELSAYLGLPFSVVTVLLTGLLAEGRVESRAPLVRTSLPQRKLLEAVMHGLQQL